MHFISHLLAHQDPDAPHTWLTRFVVSGIILFASLVYAGFFGVLGAVGTYLVAVELMGADALWLYVPIVLSLIAGLRSATRQILDYWRHFGHGGG